MAQSRQLHAIGAEIRYWRKNVRGLTLQALGDLVGVTAGGLSKLETGTEGVSLPVFERIAQALDVRLAVLIDPAYFTKMQAVEAENEVLRMRLKAIQSLTNAPIAQVVQQKLDT